MLDGKEFGEEVVALVRGYVEREIAPLKSANETLQARVAELEAMKPPEVDLTSIEKLIEAEIAKLPTPEPAKEIDMGEVAALIGEAVASLPAAKDGEDGKDADAPTAKAIWEDARPEAEEIIRQAVVEAVSALPQPKDGKDAANIVEALKDSGELVLTLQDGRLIRTGIRDGKDGDPGRDGFGFDDMDACVLDDDRTIELSFRRGEDEKAFTFKWPTMIYRGVYRADEQYEQGDMATWAGSLWHCGNTTKDKPGTDNWTLTAKKGRDGKDAKAL